MKDDHERTCKSAPQEPLLQLCTISSSIRSAHQACHRAGTPTHPSITNAAQPRLQHFIPTSPHLSPPQSAVPLSSSVAAPPTNQPPPQSIKCGAAYPRLQQRGGQQVGAAAGQLALEVPAKHAAARRVPRARHCDRVVECNQVRLGAMCVWHGAASAVLGEQSYAASQPASQPVPALTYATPRGLLLLSPSRVSHPHPHPPTYVTPRGLLLLHHGWNVLGVVAQVGVHENHKVAAGVLHRRSRRRRRRVARAGAGHWGRLRCEVTLRCNSVGSKGGYVPMQSTPSMAGTRRQGTRPQGKTVYQQSRRERTQQLTPQACPPDRLTFRPCT